MKRSLLLLIAVTICILAEAQTGYQVTVTVKPCKNEYIYLGYYYGKLKALADSAKLNANSTATFKGKQKLPGGIYFLVSSRKEILFELLLDKQQVFSVTADTSNIPNSVVFTGSTDNAQFQAYSKNIAVTGKQTNSLVGELKAATNPTDSTRITGKIKEVNKEMQDSRGEIEKKAPGSLLAALFRSMKEPVVPPADKQPGQKYDSLYAYKYYKSHYWDGFSFTDDRMLRTPIFEPRLEKYFKDLVMPDPDSISIEIDRMLAKSKASKEMYKFLLTSFVQKYINPEYMGQDAVFVHLFEKYINNVPEVDWFTEKYKKYMFERAYSMMANLLGQPASNLEMKDTLGKETPLYGVDAPFTVICFWDPTCSHCKEMVPRLDSMFQHKWKAMGIKIYGVMVDGGKEAWLSYIRENKLKDWINVYETPEQRDAVYASGKASYKQLYDVYQSPVLYLLDKDKRIIAKKLTYQQVDEVITLKMKNTAK